MPEHPSESCHIIYVGQVFQSSQMFEAEVCQEKKAQKRQRRRNSRINLNDTNEIKTDDFLIGNFIVDDSSARNYIWLDWGR